MKRNLLLTIPLLMLLFITSCGGDDEPSVDPIVGTWVLGEIRIGDPVSDQYVNATSTSTPTSTIWAETSYEIQFFEDNTYERSVLSTISDRVDDEGTWEKSGTVLDLDQEETTNPFNDVSLTTRFTIDGEISAERGMELVGNDYWFAWPVSIVQDEFALDTLEDSEIDAFFAEYGEIVEFEFTYEFDKDN